MIKANQTAVIEAPALPEPAQPAQVVAPSAPVENPELAREEKLGTLGITVSAISACTLVFFLARLLHLF